MADLVEREWPDDSGTHYEARILRPDGVLISQRVTRLFLLGWPKQRQEAAENVKREASRHAR